MSIISGTKVFLDKFFRSKVVPISRYMQIQLLTHLWCTLDRMHCIVVNSSKFKAKELLYNIVILRRIVYGAYHVLLANFG